ncbi:hypothetical protein [Agromyces sp. SYSU T00194]|uniref:hypothetical protein n=1 Tax=Agromyces chitinivorans TaxID=3158560 RepID=UPI003390C937
MSASKEYEAADAPESTDAPRSTDASEAMSEGAPAEQASARPATSRWVFAIVAGVFGMLIAYDLWEGVGNFVGVGEQVAALGIGLTTWGITVLVIGLVAPVLAYALAFWLARHRGPLAVFLLFLTAWAVVQVVQLDLEVLFGLGGLDLGSA